MSNYEGQDMREPFVRLKPDSLRRMKPNVAKLLVAQAITRPGGAEEAFITEAVEKGWRIGFREDLGTQALDPLYDVRVGEMWTNSQSEIAVVRAYAGLVAVSLGIDTIGDGK